MEKRNLEVAFCGLFCSNCSKFKNEKCPGCLKNDKASWCKIRLCCIDNGYSSCADCDKFTDVKQCVTYNNVFARVIEFVTRTDRSLCIQQIRNNGKDFLIDTMLENGKMSLPKEKN